jgi:small conductance mechanosensitive channel
LKFPNATTHSLTALRTLAITSLCLLMLASAPATAQQDAQPAQPLPAETAKRFEQMAASIKAEEEDIQSAIDRQQVAEGVAVDILAARVDRSATAKFGLVLALARDILAQRSKGFDVSAYEAGVVEDLKRLPESAKGAIERLRARLKFPSTDLPPREFVYGDQVLFKRLAEIDNVYQIVIDYIAVADKFGLDATREQEFIVNALTEAAANRSVFLELGLNNIAALRSSVSTLPKNAELTDWYSAAQARVRATAASMQRMIGLMNAAGIETRQYRKQVLSVTGEITTDVLDVGIVTNLVKEWGGGMIDIAAKEGPKWLLRILLMALIIFVFFQISKLAQKVVIRGLTSRRVNVSHLLKEMITSAVSNLIILFGILIAVSQLGVSLGPLLAGLGIAGFIIGFALQDSLSNFASGMLILIYRPFDVGDVVSSGGVTGKVSAMSLVNTTFKTFDNQVLVVPNNLIWQSVITNVTALQERRIDMVFGISYGDDIEKAQKILENILQEHEAVLDDPEPMVRLHEFGESSINFIVRPWVKTTEYWETFWSLNKAVKLRFDAEGITIPFPQRDVHLFDSKAD